MTAPKTRNEMALCYASKFVIRPFSRLDELPSWLCDYVLHYEAGYDSRNEEVEKLKATIKHMTLIGTSLRLSIESLSKQLGSSKDHATLLAAEVERLKTLIMPSIEQARCMREVVDELEIQASSLAAALENLKHFNNHTIDEEMWRIDTALQSYRNSQSGEKGE